MTASPGCSRAVHLPPGLLESGPVALTATGAPVTAAGIRQFLGNSYLPYPVVTLVRDGSQLNPRSYTRTVKMAGGTGPTFLDSEAVLEALSRGATAMLPNLEMWLRPVADACVWLSRETAHKVGASVFVTPPRERGLAVHRDRVHVLVVQQEGEKLWEVHVPKPGAPSGHAADPGPLAMRIRLRPGDALWVPAWAAHSATADDEESLHISFTFAPITSGPSAGTVSPAPSVDTVLMESGLLPPAIRDPGVCRLRVGYLAGKA